MVLDVDGITEPSNIRNSSSSGCVDLIWSQRQMYFENHDHGGAGVREDQLGLLFGVGEGDFGGQVQWIFNHALYYMGFLS